MVNAHESKLDRITKSLKAAPKGVRLKLDKGTVSHQVPMRTKPAHHVDVSGLDEIIDVDADAMTCTCEPGVTFDRLVQATLEHGLVPVVVPELKGITVGGAVAGCSIESTSFRNGGFHDTCLEYEIVTATGDRLICRPDNEHALLFQMQHGAFGTLGVITQMKFRLMPARPYVRMTYEKHASLPQYLAAMERHAKDDSLDFIDGFIHGPGELVLNLGRFVSDAPYTNRYDRLQVYFKSTRTRVEDYLTTYQYFFRYDRGVTRVHPFLSSSQVLWLAQKLQPVIGRTTPSVTVDLFLPFSRVERFFEWYAHELNFFPLWCVPYRRVRDYEWLTPRFFEGVPDTMFLDLAIYGMKQPAGRNAYREIETALNLVGGMKTLISHNHYTEEEFWRIWNRQNHEAAKAVVDPLNVLGDLYTKTCLRHA